MTKAEVFQTIAAMAFLTGLLPLAFALLFKLADNSQGVARTNAADKKAQAKLSAVALGDPYDVEPTPDEPARAEGGLSLADAALILRAEVAVLAVPERSDLGVVIAEVISQGEPVPDAEAVPPVTLRLEIDHPVLPPPSYTAHLPKHLHPGAEAAERASHSGMTGYLEKLTDERLAELVAEYAKAKAGAR